MTNNSLFIFIFNINNKHGKIYSLGLPVSTLASVRGQVGDTLLYLKTPGKKNWQFIGQLQKYKTVIGQYT